MKKFIFNMERSVIKEGRTFYLIRAARDFGSIKMGEEGGYVEVGSTIGGNYDDFSWVYPNSYFSGELLRNSRVERGAVVINSSIDKGAIISRGSKVMGSIISGRVIVSHCDISDATITVKHKDPCTLTHKKIMEGYLYLCKPKAKSYKTRMETIE